MSCRMQLTNNVKAVFPALKVNLCLLANSHNLYSNAQCLQLFIALLRLREHKIQIQMQMMHASKLLYEHLFMQSYA